MSKKIIVTGGCGYIGSHTIVDLIQNGYDVISIDDNSRSNENILGNIKEITGKRIKNYKINLCSLPDTKKVFLEHQDAVGVIHFAAYKDVYASCANPLIYYHNNLESLNNVLRCSANIN